MDAPPYSAAEVDVIRLPDGVSERDRVAVEEPLELRIGGEPVAVTMRTPGHDEELALGFCLSEGLSPESARIPDDLAANTIDVVASGFDAERLRRSFYTSSSCGVCGKGALEAVAVEAPRVESQLRVPLSVITGLPDRLRAEQAAFAVTGGLHATGLFDADGTVVCVREDVGRHNAFDKVVGRAFLDGLLPLAAAHRVRQRAAVLRARAEGGGRRLPGARRRRRAVEPRRRARHRPRRHALRLRPRRNGQRLHRDVADRLTGRVARRRGEHALRLAEGARASSAARRSPIAPGALLGDACDERIAVGKGDEELPFPVLADGVDEYASIHGLVAGLRASTTDVCVVLPVDCPNMTADALRSLADACLRRGRAADGAAPGRVSQVGALGADERRALHSPRDRWPRRCNRPAGRVAAREREYSS